MKRSTLKKLIREAIIEVLLESKEHSNLEQFVENLMTIIHWFPENSGAKIITSVKNKLDSKIHDRGISDINFVAWVLCSNNGQKEIKELSKLLENHRGKSRKVNILLSYLDAGSINEDFYKCLGNYIKNYKQSISSLLTTEESIKSDTISFLNSNYKAKEMVSIYSKRTVMDKDYA